MKEVEKKVFAFFKKRTFNGGKIDSQFSVKNVCKKLNRHHAQVNPAIEKYEPTQFTM